LGYFGLAWASMLTGTRSSGRVRAFQFFDKKFRIFQKVIEIHKM
jgi:hypothetical protein